MKRFRYLAEDPKGARREGELSAATDIAARQQLQDQGWRIIELSYVPDQPVAPPASLSQRESEEVVVAVAELSRSELPLVEGLRAAAQQSGSARVARALLQIADDVERGHALESLMGEQGKSLPPHVRGLVAAAARTHRLGAALDELVEHHRAAREVWTRVWGAIAYPLFVLAMTLFVLGFLPVFIIPEFKKMFEEFELELPAITRAMIALSDGLIWLGQSPGVWVMLAAAIALVVLPLLSTCGIGPPALHRLTTTMPLVGPIWQWSGTAAFARLLAMMLQHGIPLPEALLLARDGVRDVEIRAAGKLLARGVEQGRSLSDLLAESKRLPASITPFVRWGEQTGNLPEALHAVTDMLLQRVQMRTLLLRSIAPPVVFILVGLLAGFMIVALFLPLITLIQGLS